MKCYSETQDLSPTEIKIIAGVHDAIKASVAVYLNEAKRVGESDESVAMEAVAIERAVIADTLSSVVNIDTDGRELDPAAGSNKQQITRVERRLSKLADKMCKRFEGNQNLKNLGENLRLSVVGLGMRPTS